MATPEQSGQTETPLYRSKYIYEDFEEKKNGKEKIIKSPTLVVKKAKTIPRAIVKATLKTILITVTKLVKKARKAKTIYNSPYNITKI